MCVGGEELPRLSGRVLLADDVAVNRKLIATFLTKCGALVEAAENGRIAVEKAMSALEAGKPFDVIFMDMQMPELDGYGASTELRRNGYGGPIVALTASALLSDREKCIAAGCDDYLAKPVDRRRLIRLTARYLPERGKCTEGGAAAPPRSAGGEGTTPVARELAADPEMGGILREALEWLPGQVASIREAAGKLDFETLGQLAHAIKGVAGSCGFESIMNAAVKLERDAKAKADPADLARSVAEMAAASKRAGAEC